VDTDSQKHITFTCYIVTLFNLTWHDSDRNCIYF